MAFKNLSYRQVQKECVTRKNAGILSKNIKCNKKRVILEGYLLAGTPVSTKPPFRRQSPRRVFPFRNMTYRALQKECMNLRNMGYLTRVTRCTGNRAQLERYLRSVEQQPLTHIPKPSLSPKKDDGQGAANRPSVIQRPRTQRPTRPIRKQRPVRPAGKSKRPAPRTAAGKQRPTRRAGKSKRPRTSAPPKYLSGVNSIAKWYSEKTRRTIYLLSDIHSREGECRRDSSFISVENFIVWILDTFDDVDIFLEYKPVALVTKRPFLDLKMGKDTVVRSNVWESRGRHQRKLRREASKKWLRKSHSLHRTVVSLEGCLELLKNCPWKRARVHAVDVRNTMFAENPGWLEYTVSTGNACNTVRFDSRAGRQVVKDIFSKVFHDGEFDPHAYFKMAQRWMTDTRTRLNRGFRTLNKRTKTVVEEWFLDLLKKEAAWFRKHGLQYLTVKGTRAIVPPDVNESRFATLMSSFFVPWVDLYFAVRYLRTYDVSESGHLPCAVNSLYYAGGRHIVNALRLLKRLGFVKTWESKPTRRELCVNITDIPVPLFP